MKIKIIKVAFQENQEIDINQYIDTKQYEIISTTNQIIVENKTAYCYISLNYKVALYSELEKTQTHKENLKQEIFNLIKEKYPTYKKTLHNRQDIADNYKKIQSIYDFNIIKNFGETTIKKEKHILEDVLQIIKKYQIEI